MVPSLVSVTTRSWCKCPEVDGFQWGKQTLIRRNDSFPHNLLYGAAWKHSMIVEDLLMLPKQLCVHEKHVWLFSLLSYMQA